LGEAPGGWRSEATREPKRIKDEANLTKALHSLVGVLTALIRMVDQTSVRLMLEQSHPQGSHGQTTRHAPPGAVA